MLLFGVFFQGLLLALQLLLAFGTGTVLIVPLCLLPLHFFLFFKAIRDYNES